MTTPADGGCGCHAEATEAQHLQRADVDSSAWDGPAAMSSCASSDTPASCYSSICAGKKTGDTALQSSWALPHHKHPGDPPNAAGVKSALSRLPQTQGLTNAAAATKHLEAHMSAISPAKAGTPAEVRAARAHAHGGDRRALPGAAARLEPFRAYFKRAAVVIDGKELAQLDGYASITGIEYEMWDCFGPYGETVAPSAFDDTLAASPDVSFLLNHKGMTMARTTPAPGRQPTLALDADPRGLHSRAWLNPERSDIADLLTAVDDGLITEMSFAFMITAGSWDDDYEHFTIEAVDLDRGDVSAVNYGANPYTSIEARSREIMASLQHLPDGAQRAALDTLTRRFGRPSASLRAAGDTDADDSVNALIASLDATLDQASLLAQGISREGLPEDVGQALDLITAAESIADELMEMLGIYDPDDPSGENAAGSKPHRGKVTGTTYASGTEQIVIPAGASVEHVTRHLGGENGRSIDFYEQMLRLS